MPMRDAWGGRWILAGVAGAVLGALLEALVNRLAGRILLIDGMMWDAVLGILVLSLPSFTRMGHLVVKSDRPAVNFIVGIVMFLVISVVLVTIFFGIFLLLGRLLS
jgi:ABC-type branched-subunit amino acid transport system permease subunit